MILVIIIMVAWLVILGPNLLKRRSRTVGGSAPSPTSTASSASSSTPPPSPWSTPAYRLRAVDGSAVVAEGADGRPAPVAPEALRGRARTSCPDRPWPSWATDPTGQRGRSDEAGRPIPVAAPAACCRRSPDSAGPDCTPPARCHARGLARRRRRDTLGVLTRWSS